MEGKGVRAAIIGLLILGLVVPQIEAKPCCTSGIFRVCYFSCLNAGIPGAVCASHCGCTTEGRPCPRSHTYSSMLENSDDAIEQVTTDLEAARRGPIVICPTPKSKSCFTFCYAAPRACARNCRCIYVPTGLN